MKKENQNKTKELLKFILAVIVLVAFAVGYIIYSNS